MSPNLIMGAAVAAGAAVQSASGIGLVLICGPVLVLAVGPAEAVRLALVLSLILNAALLLRRPSAVDVQQAWRLALPAVATTVPLALVVRRVENRILAAVAGAVLLAAALLSWRGHRWPWMTTRGGTWTAGAASGAMNAVAATAGPFAALYALNANWPSSTRVITLQAYFAALNIVDLCMLGPPRRLDVLAATVAGLLIGAAAGRIVANRLSEALTRRIVLILAATGAVTVLAQALA